MFKESITTTLAPNLFGISTFLGFLESGWNLNGVTAMLRPIYLLKFLQVSAKSITHFEIVTALYMPVLFSKHRHSVDSINSISVDTYPTDPIRSV